MAGDGNVVGGVLRAEERSLGSRNRVQVGELVCFIQRDAPVPRLVGCAPQPAQEEMREEGPLEFVRFQ